MWPRDRNVLFATCPLARINYYNKEFVAVGLWLGERGSSTAVGRQLKVVQIDETKVEGLYIKYTDWIRWKS